jgi:hypothetical protein
LPRDPVRRPYDATDTLRVCTAHISPYSEVPDDSSSFTETVGEKTAQHIQLHIQLAKGARPKHPGAHAGTQVGRYAGARQNNIGVPMLPQLRAVPESEAEPVAPPRVFVPGNPDDSYVRPSGGDGQGYEAQSVASAPPIVSGTALPQMTAKQQAQNYQAFGAQQVSVPHTSATQAPNLKDELTAYAPYPPPPFHERGPVVGGGRTYPKREEPAVHATYAWSPPSQNTWPGTIWDATPILCFIFMLLLASVIVVLLLSGVFT